MKYPFFTEGFKICFSDSEFFLRDDFKITWLFCPFYKFFPITILREKHDFVFFD